MVTTSTIDADQIEGVGYPLPDHRHNNPNSQDAQLGRVKSNLTLETELSDLIGETPAFRNVLMFPSIVRAFPEISSKMYPLAVNVEPGAIEGICSFLFGPCDR